jgi:RimJ/RimL family protein N-acetyltransferase
MTEADIPAVVAACQDPEIPRWTHVPSPYTEQDARGWLRHVAEEQAAGRTVHFLIVDAADDALLGAIDLRFDREREVGTIGYWVAREARRRGVASSATRLLARWGLSERSLARIELFADRRNEASVRAAERAGFVREGLLRSYAHVKGDRGDYVVFSLLPSDLRGGERS